MNRKIFINRRRKGSERRESDDPCKHMDIDIYHRKRRKSGDRRQERTLDEDYYAYLATQNADKSDDVGDTSHH